MHRNFYSLVPVWKQILRIFHLSGAAAVELAQHTVGGQQFQRQRIYLLKAAGGLVPQLSVMALQRELTAHLAQQPGDQSQLVGKGPLSSLLRPMVSSTSLAIRRDSERIFAANGLMSFS